MPRNRAKGVTLVETLLSMVIFLIVFVAAVGLVDRFQSLAWNLSLLQEKEANMSAVPLLLARWILPAGNNRFRSDCVGIAGNAGRLDLQSDIDGPLGFPDNTLKQSYESISVRRNGSDMQVKSDRGTFQPVLKNVGLLRFRVQELPVIEVSMAGQLDRPTVLMGSPPVADQTSIRFYAWNFRKSLFAEAP